MTALNSASHTTTLSLSPSEFSSNIIAMPTVASPQALLYNGVPLPTALATTDSGSSSPTASLILAGGSSRSVEPKISTSPTASPAPGTSQSPSLKSKSYAWIAGAVIAPLSIILLLIAFLFFRQRRKMGRELRMGEEAMGGMNRRPELHGQSFFRSPVQLDGRPRSELPAREPAASELF
jgi:hypothetical protein